MDHGIDDAVVLSYNYRVGSPFLPSWALYFHDISNDCYVVCARS